MKKAPLFLPVLTAVALYSGAVMANPFISGGPSEVNSFAMNFFQTPFLQKILLIQREIHEALTSQIDAVKEGKSLTPLWTLLFVSFGYGVFHVLAPGHGKVIVASYFIGNKAKWQEGVWAGLIMAVGHTITAVAVVLILYLLMGFSQMRVLEKARYVELLGYGLIAAIGIWLAFKALTNKPECSACGHDHGHGHHHHHDHAPAVDTGKSLFAAASLVPCSGSMIILLFTAANGVLGAGLMAVVAIALGMWITITAFGLAAIFLRRSILDVEQSPWRKRLAKAARLFAAMLVIATGGLLFLGTVYSLAV
jgi:nickel/cobalt exporter